MLLTRITIFFTILTVLASSCSIFQSPPIILQVVLDPNGILVGSTVKVWAQLDEESGDGPFQFEWSLSTGEVYTEDTLYLPFSVAEDVLITLNLSNNAGTDSYRKTIPIRETAAVTFFSRTRADDVWVPWKLRVGEEEVTITHIFLEDYSPLCGTTELEGAYTFEGLPPGTLTYYLDKGQGFREYTMEITQACHRILL